MKRKLKALFDFLRLPDGDGFVWRVTAIHDALLGNVVFSNPPVDLAIFKTAISNYAAAMVVALDGSRQAIANRKKLREVVVKMTEQLGHYVEANGSDDPATFTSSGFQLRQTTRVPSQPLVQPTIDRIDQGKTGELLIAVTAVSKARIYEIRHAPVGPGEPAPSTFDITTVALVRRSISFGNLTPGMIYVFQVRAFGTLGFTDWSNPVQRMCI